MFLVAFAGEQRYGSFIMATESIVFSVSDVMDIREKLEIIMKTQEIAQRNPLPKDLKPEDLQAIVRDEVAGIDRVLALRGCHCPALPCSFGLCGLKNSNASQTQ